VGSYGSAFGYSACSDDDGRAAVAIKPAATSISIRNCRSGRRHERERNNHAVPGEHRCDLDVELNKLSRSYQPKGWKLE
jgi:hypothetical protein